MTGTPAGAHGSVPDVPTVRPLVLTMGEPAGVGGEITLKAWLRRGADRAIPPFAVIDAADRLERLATRLGLDVPIRPIADPADALAAFDAGLPVLHQPLAREVVPGKPDADNAPAVIAAIMRAVALVQTGAAAAVVTNPIHKKTLYRSGFAFPGHTEFLADLAGGGAQPVMMLVGGGLRVVPVTIHMSLRNAIDALDGARIVQAAATADAALRRDFGIARPRLAVAGLNPHAGEEGDLGSEEAEIVAPAIARLRERGLDVIGPVPPDTMFTATARAGYDAAICMYHDQALIPLKALAFDQGVNVTLGLPFVRTSPDHGTAFDIAGRGVADEASLIAALKLAAAMVQRRIAAAASV